jgi:hypothetical protein
MEIEFHKFFLYCSQWGYPGQMTRVAGLVG